MKDNGGDLLKKCYMNDIRVLDLSRMQWSRLRTHGTPPAGRFGHSLVLSEDDAIVFGGWSGSFKEAPGVAFSLKDKIKGDLGKQGDTEQTVEETCDYCLTLRTSDMNWVRNKYIGVPPSKRYGHSATAIGPHLIIFGGFDGGKPLSDVIVLRDRSVGEKSLNPAEEAFFGGKSSVTPGSEGAGGPGFDGEDGEYGDEYGEEGDYEGYDEN